MVVVVVGVLKGGAQVTVAKGPHSSVLCCPKSGGSCVGAKRVVELGAGEVLV